MMVAFELFKCKSWASNSGGSASLNVTVRIAAGMLQCKIANAENNREAVTASLLISVSGQQKRRSLPPILRSGDRGSKITNEISNFEYQKLHPYPTHLKG